MNLNSKHILLLLFFGVFLLSCKTTRTLPYSSTSATYAQDFKQHLEPNAKLLKSWYHYTVEMTQDRKYILKKYYPEKKAMVSRNEFSDSGLSILEGKSSYYTDDGALTSEGMFSKDKRTGEWKSYRSDTGQLREKGNYLLDEKDGLWTQYDSLGLVSATYTYEENKKNGPYQIFENGKLYESGKFLDGDVVNTKMATEGTESKLNAGLKVIEKMPEYPGCDQNMADKERKNCAQTAMLQFIYTNIKYPQKARNLGVQGTAIVRFVVDKDGSIGDITALRGICAPIEAECIRVVKMMPQWIPGEQNEETVPVYFNLPIKFKLE